MLVAGTRREGIASLVGAVVAAAACGGESAGPDAASGCETAPALGECYVGDVFADCGGTGEAVLACPEEGDCLWFDGGCVASGFTVSPCPAGDICCVDGWPFPDPSPGWNLWELLYGLGREPWDVERAGALSVVVDGAITAVPASVACDGYVPPHNAETSPCFQRKDLFVDFHVERQMADTLALSIWRSGYEGWWLWIEVLELSSPSPSARACQYRFTDERAPICPEAVEAVCAEAGVVTLSRVPDGYDDVRDVAVRAVLAFPGGVGVELAL